MPRRTITPADLLNSESPEELREQLEILEQLENNPESVVRDLIVARRSCRDAAQAVEGLESMLSDLVSGNASLFHLETVRHREDGEVRAICKMGSTLQELGVHPDVPVEVLERLQPWEYVCVCEGVIVRTWHDDPELLGIQFGDIVTFEGHADRDRRHVRVSQPGREQTIVTLAPSLQIEELHPGMKLILQRDDPRWAIGVLPAEHAESRFEVPLDRMHAPLDELAGLEELSNVFCEDILLRIVFTGTRDQFDLAPLQGALLYSYMPGMGKTKFCEGLAVWLRDLGKQRGFEVALYHVKPNSLKSMWWGEDARIVREDLFGSIRARQNRPRDRPLVQLVIFDEIDSLQKRGGGEQMASSSSQSDALEGLLVEMQGLGGNRAFQDGPPAHLLCIGLTNRPDRLDEALKRPGRFGDLVRAMPSVTRESAVDIMGIYARKASLPWWVDGQVQSPLPPEEVRARFLAPAVARVFPLVVARYATDTQRTFDITAGQILAGVHYQHAMNAAKRRAGLRSLQELGVPAICPEDVMDCLLDAAINAAAQMEADPGMLVHQLQIKVPVTRVTAVPKTELEQHRYLKLHSA
ncbi:MAG: AAA family ATPase [Planctomycetaceae bacterium]